MKHRSVKREQANDDVSMQDRGIRRFHAAELLRSYEQTFARVEYGV